MGLINGIILCFAYLGFQEKDCSCLKLRGTHDISKEFLQDFYNNNELGLTAYIEERSKTIWTEIVKDFKIGQDEGWIRKELNVEFIFYFMQKITSNLADKELLRFFNTTQDMIMELTNLFVYGITPHENREVQDK